MTFFKLSLFIFISLILVSFFISCDVTWGKEKTAKELVGTYRLDLTKTKLNNNYSRDSNIYKDLTITFSQDSTFQMNIDVPFFYNRTGKWKSGNVNEWCWMLFDSFKYDHKNENSGSQFTRPYEEKLDTFFFIVVRLKLWQ